MKLLDIECAQHELRHLLSTMPADPTGPHAYDILRARNRITELLPDLDRLRAIARVDDTEAAP